ncbi:hypothetical protein Back2_28580 [Nocardioides baekrokdamisoli]|uniref:Uncharacterized protein n=1 Tax=Nocardioides baekrokdamisoli TaxID=1804624 RepID=A0A3G9IY12_9ACTN|nr:hypothetical protein Back2_28580 [Nocardioides baekrokdamisoli]
MYEDVAEGDVGLAPARNQETHALKRLSGGVRYARCWIDTNDLRRRDVPVLHCYEVPDTDLACDYLANDDGPAPSGFEDAIDAKTKH